MENSTLPKIGLRMVKSAVVVFLSLSLSLLRGENGIPFYVAIAAVLCIQPTMESTLQAGISRCFGTLVGGFWGTVVLFINLFLIKDYNIFFHYIVVSLFVILVIYTAVVFKRPGAVFISCVVFLSITVSHIGDTNPFLFVLNRMLDTFLGVVIAMVVNRFYLPKENG